ncbi:MAG: DUF421 domain-containing protein [Ruminococcaceae bacterium]|nr:DUF421 domain-containing protein [Oscillospiraceae bacterium]
MYTLFFRTVITYIILISAMRLMGKRQLGELELSEFVITMLLSELASIPIADNTIPFTFSVIPIAILISLEVIVSFISIKSRKAKKIIGGNPSIIINKGKICKEEMKKVRISLDELLSQLRLKDISDINDVQYAILEENGQVSVIPKVYAKNATLGDLNIKSDEKGIIHTLVADGEISDFNLKLTGHSREWLFKQIKKHNCKLKDVFLFSIDDAENINFIKNGDV